MDVLKTLVAATAVGTIVLAFRDVENGAWLSPALPGLGGGIALEEDEDWDDSEEPVLGYDGMDRDTLIDWLRDAELDVGTLARIHHYETANFARQAVLDTLDDLMD